MRYFRAGNFVVAEKTRTGQRYSLKAWQFDLLSQFDGKRTFEEVAKRVYDQRPAAFTAVGLLNFYHWLYTEDLVLCECESIFEWVGGEEGAGDEAISHSRSAGRWLGRRVGVRRALVASAAVAVALSVLRLVAVTSPVSDPLADGIQITSERLPKEPIQTRFTLAAQAPAQVVAGGDYDTDFRLGETLLVGATVSPNLQRLGSISGRP